ncbi:MAG: gluconate 2-dehydrogenase subunit 3 family protein [Opitutae bacterium]|nr:gluconate 2-dehydrogenase subunit 3 family protein [Opitutae bacterium]
MKWMLAASVAVHYLHENSAASTHQTTLEGYGTDPNLLAGEVPWERTMTPQQLRATAKLADIILPRTSPSSPSATEVHVHDFIDEWISAPYPSHREDREMIIEGLVWFDRESKRRFNMDFHRLTEEQATAICDDICYAPEAPPELEDGARFFSKFRNLTLGGYYTTDIGAKDVGYVGNVALPAFDGPPPKVLEKLGIDKAPW